MSIIVTDPPDLVAHIESRLVRPRPDCLIWTGSVDRGYGRVTVGGITKRVHRVVWELQHGPIPDGLTIDHLCRVKACVNTDHMELVTASENVLRGHAFKRKATPQPPWVRTHCKRGHEFTEENTLRRSDGSRRCLTCHTRRRAEYDARRREQYAAGRVA